MEYKIISHSYQNTGGNCMVSIFEVYFPTDNKTLYCSVNDELVTLTTIDVVNTEDVDDYEEVTIATEYYYPTELNKDCEYFELFSYCIAEYDKKNM